MNANNKLFCEYWTTLNRFKRIKQLNNGLSKEENKEVLRLIDEAAISFPISLHLYDHGKHHKIHPLRTIKRDTLINELWHLIQAE